MGIFRMIIQIGMLYIFYLIGMWIQTTFQLFIPGSVIGMLLFLTLLLLKVISPKICEGGAGLLIDHLPLLFLPATVGIVSYLYLFAGRGILLIFISLFSTVLVMVSAGAVSEWVVIRRGQKNE